MVQSGDTNPLDAEIQRLEARVAALINLCEKLDVENRSLRRQRDQMMAERARLIERADATRNRVEAMVSRLKALEHES